MLLLAACGDTGQELVSFPVHAAGTGERSFAVEGWSVTIERADVGFGPMYLCATSFADLDVCPRAEAELLDVGTVDALDDAPQMMGTARAITGTARSAMLDYGIGWLTTARRPAPFDGAPDGHSAIFRVRASRGADELEVHVELDIEPRIAGGSAVIGAPTGEHAITGREALTVRLDPAAWWRRVDFDALAMSDEDGDGVVTVARGDVAWTALTIAMTSGRVPRFEWTD